jgi:hypothetical protein
MRRSKIREIGIMSIGTILLILLILILIGVVPAWPHTAEAGAMARVVSSESSS